MAGILGVLGAAAQPATSSLVPFQPGFADLKAYLNLTDGQVQAIQSVQKSRMQAEQAIYQEINQKQQQLNSLLQSGSTDAASIGQLMIDIQTLRKKLPLNGEPYRTESLAVLSQDQRNKLPDLVNALRLQAAGWQAVNANLIDAPKPPVLIATPLPAVQPIDVVPDAR